MKSHWKKLGVLLVAMLILATLVPATTAQDDMGFHKTFDLQGPAEDGLLAGIDPSGQIVEWWHNHSGSREERLIEMVDEFNADNPWGITINASNQGGYGDIYQKVVAGLQTGELPTLVVAYLNQALAYHQTGGVVDMNIFVADETWGLNEAEQADYIAAFFNQDVSPDGTRVGFPPNRSVESMYYNKSALEEMGYDGPPTTWEEFREMTCAFTENGWSGYDGETMGYSIRTDASNIAALTYALGGDMWDPETLTYNYNNPDTIAALSFMQDLLNDGCANVIAERFQDQDDLAAGKNLFYMGSSSGLPFIQSAVDDAENPIDWGITFIPYADTPAVDIYGASVSILQGGSISIEQQLAAWLFVRWFTEAEQQGRWAEASKYFPVRISTTAELDSIFAEVPQYEEAWNLLLDGEGRVEPQLSGYDVVRDEAQEAFNAILNEGADVETTLEALDIRAGEIQAEFDAG